MLNPKALEQLIQLDREVQIGTRCMTIATAKVAIAHRKNDIAWFKIPRSSALQIRYFALFWCHRVLLFSPMRTHIDIDDALLEEARSLGGYTSIKAAVNVALAEHVKQLKRQQLLALRGQLHWQGDLESLRASRDSHAR